MNQKSVDVSIILPVHNGGKYLREALNSVLSDAPKSAEILVIDDASVDDSSDIAHSYEDCRIRVITVKGHRGLAHALNIGLEAANGRYIARMDADDVSLEGRFSAQAKFLEAHENVGLVGTQIHRFSGPFKTFGNASCLPLDHGRIVKLLMRGQHAICHPTIMFRAETAKGVGGFWSQGVAEDWDFYLKMGRMMDLANLQQVGLRYRVHGASINADGQIEVQHRIHFAIARANEASLSDPTEADYLLFLAQLSTVKRANIRRKAAGIEAYRVAQTSQTFGRSWRLAYAAALLPERMMTKIWAHRA